MRGPSIGVLLQMLDTMKSLTPEQLQQAKASAPWFTPNGISIRFTGTPETNMSTVTPITASQIPQETSRDIKPLSKTIISPVRSNKPIMKKDPTRPTNQYQVGELMWDKDKKKWVRDMWDKEDQRASRSLQRDRRSEQRDRANKKYRVIKAPKF